MAKKIKYTQKELKGPDKFTTTVISGFEYFSDHTTKILVIVVAIIVVLSSAYIYHGYTKGKEDKASVMFDQAVQTYEAGDYEQALKEFMEVKNKYPSKNISGIALYYAGLSNYYLGNYEESVNNLEAFIASGISGRVLTQSAIFTQGLAKFEEGKYQQAIEYLSKIEAERGDAYAEQSKLLIAKSYEKMGKPEQARNVYEELDQMQAGMNPGMPPVTVNQSSQPTGAQ